MLFIPSIIYPHFVILAFCLQMMMGTYEKSIVYLTFKIARVFWLKILLLSIAIVNSYL